MKISCSSQNNQLHKIVVKGGRYFHISHESGTRKLCTLNHFKGNKAWAMFLPNTKSSLVTWWSPGRIAHGCARVQPTSTSPRRKRLHRPYATYSTLRAHKDVWNLVFGQTLSKPVSMVQSGWRRGCGGRRGGIWYTDAKPVSRIPMPKRNERRATKLQQCSSWIILTLRFLERTRIHSNNSWIIFGMS